MSLHLYEIGQQLQTTVFKVTGGLFSPSTMYIACHLDLKRSWCYNDPSPCPNMDLIIGFTLHHFYTNLKLEKVKCHCDYVLPTTKFVDTPILQPNYNYVGVRLEVWKYLNSVLQYLSRRNNDCWTKLGPSSLAKGYDPLYSSSTWRWVERIVTLG